MSIHPEPHIDRFHQHHPHVGEERCPLCNQILPQDQSRDDLEQRQQNKMNARIETVKKEVKEQAEKEAAARETQIRQEEKSKASEELKDSIAKADAEKRRAQEEKKAADERLAKMKADQEVRTNQAVQKALQEQRETLQDDKTKSIQKIEAKSFENTQKLQRHTEQLQRQLEQKSNDELGEGAEIDLYEALREHFDSDDITRIKKGQPGADILHNIVHNGQVCGSIIYDSKNHRQWRNSFVEKLKTDQLAAKADHAILTTSSFPAGAHQLQVKGEVIVLNPARAVELVRIIREHLVQTHRLRLSADEREKKTEALYAFITSERCRQLLARHDEITSDLLSLDAKEKDAHDKTWKKRGQLVRDAQRVQGDYVAEIDRIIEGAGELL